MKLIKRYRTLMRLSIFGSVVSFLSCVVLGIRSWAIGLGGHGMDAVEESSASGDNAERFFFLSMVLIVVAVLLLYKINQLESKNSV